MCVDSTHTIMNTYVNNIYEFPIHGIINKDTKYSKNANYTLLITRENQEINFVYESYNADMEPNRTIIRNINIANISAINRLFKTDSIFVPTSGIALQSIELDPSVKGNDSINYVLSFFNMGVLILREIMDISSIISFNQKTSARTNNYLEIKDSRLTFITETPKNKSEKYLCSSTDSIVWQLPVTENTRYELMSYESLFKINYGKAALNTDKIYYAFTAFLDKFMFIKIITPMIIKDNVIKSLNETFLNEYQVLECYICMKQS